MGTSITTCLLAAGHPVIAFDKDISRRRTLRRRVYALLREMRLEKVLSKEPAALTKKLTVADNLGPLGETLLVIECIFEDLDAKRNILRKIEDAVGPEVLIGSNTSALPVTELQRGALHPEQS